MQTTSLSKTFKNGVGRRILGLFILAGILPVIVTALLAYFEIGRGLEQQVNQPASSALEGIRRAGIVSPHRFVTKG